MGGKAFAGRTISIARCCVQTTLNSFREEVLVPLGVEGYVTIGSTGKKAVSGDLDIAVRLPEGVDKRAFIAAARNLKSVGADNVRAVGSLASFCFPITGSEGNVQIDVMFASGSLDDVAWLMSGSGDGEVPGVYRNLLLSFAARNASAKLSISFPGGIKNLATGVREESPELILRALGIDASPDEASSFELLLLTMAERGWHHSLSCPETGFESYVTRYLNDDCSRIGAEHAVYRFRSVMSSLQPEC